MLDIICRALTAAGISFVRLDGSCSAQQRSDALAAALKPHANIWDGP